MPKFFQILEVALLYIIHELVDAVLMEKLIFYA